MRRQGLWTLFALACLADGGIDAQFQPLRLDEATPKDMGMEAYLAPFREGVEAYSSEAIGFAAEPLSRSRPECGLSNLVADALRTVGSREFGEAVDLAFTNFGGLRRDLPEGPLTMGLITELSPFENYLCYLEVEGDFVRELASYAAGGVALSGVEVVLDEDGAVLEVRVGGEPLDPRRTYRVVTIDYLLSAWDELFLKERIQETRVSANLVQRDAIVLHLSELNASGLRIYDSGEGRVKKRRGEKSR